MIAIIFLILPVIFTFLTYFSTSNIIISLIVGVVSGFYLLIITRKRIDRFIRKTKRYHSCYKFINSFLISLSIRNTVGAALTNVSENMDEDYKNELDGLEDVTGLETLTYLKKYYSFHIYDLFVNVVSLYEEQGGNVLNMSSLIIEQSRGIEDYINRLVNISKKKVIEFSVLWIFAIVILVALRFVLGQFYVSIISQLIFQIAIAIIFIFITISIDILVKRITKLEIRGYSNEEL